MSIPSLITNGIGFGGIPGLILRGLEANQDQILPTPVTVTRFVGNPTILELTTGVPSRYTIFINGVDRSENVRIGAPVGPGINFNRNSGSRAQATFQIYSPSGLYEPQANDPVFIYELSQLVYRGFVDKCVGVRITGSESVVFYDVTCVDAGGLFDKRIFWRKYEGIETGMPATVWQVVNEVVHGPLADLGINLVWTPALDFRLNGMIFNFIPVTEVLNQLATIINSAWVVDANLNLYFYSLTDGYSSAAPASFLTNSQNWQQFKVTKSRALFANRIYAKTSRNIGATQTDTFVATQNQLLFLIRNPVFYPELPVVKVNGVDKVVVWFQDFPNGIYGPGAPYFDFYFSGLVLVYDQFKTAISAGATVTVRYSSPLSSVAVAEDTASIASDGLQEMVIEAGDIPDLVTLQSIADGALLRAKVVPSEVEIITRVAGFDIRQLITVNIDVPLVNDSFIITQITSKEIAKSYFEHTITAQSDQIQLAGMSRYIGMLISRARSPIDRIIERLGFNVAGTLRGLTNPGLAIGVAEGLHVAQKDSQLGWASLRFKSIDDGTPITSQIEIDIFKNGTSIFGSNPKLIMAAGKSIAQVWKFATDPYPISRGDRFTFEVLTADSAAKNGSLDIVGVS